MKSPPLLSLPALHNPLGFALALSAAHFSEHAGITPDAWQRKLLLSHAPRILVNCSRQSGKTTTIATLATHTALYNRDALVVILSPSQRQSGELFRKVLSLYRGLERPVSADAENALSLDLENGSRIVTLPGKENTVRGYSGVKLLIIDEAAKVVDDLYRTVRPMLAVSNGQLIVASTPFGTRGFFYEEYRDRANWDYYEIPATQCPRITPEFLAEERRKQGAWWYSQEYECQFLDAQTSAFRQADIDAAMAEDYEQWDLRQFMSV